MRPPERLVNLEKRLRKIEALVDGRFDTLCDAVERALVHILELEEAWRNGALESRDGLNGYRATMNVKTRVALEIALRELTNAPKKKP